MKNVLELDIGEKIIIRHLNKSDVEGVWYNFNEVIDEGMYLPVFFPVRSQLEKESWYRYIKKENEILTTNANNLTELYNQQREKIDTQAEELNQKKKELDDKNSQINNLKSDLEKYIDYIEESNKIKKEAEDLKNQIGMIKNENENLKKEIEKYLRFFANYVVFVGL